MDGSLSPPTSHPLPEDSTVTPKQQGHLRHSWAQGQQGFSVRHRNTVRGPQELLKLLGELEGIQALLISPDALNLLHREAKHYQALRLEVQLKLIYLCVVPDHCASKQGDILKEQHLALQRTQALRLSAGQQVGKKG